MKEALPKLLIVDDDADNLAFVALILREDYNITTASSGETAMDLLRAESFDLVLTDVAMPGASGLELCLCIHQNWPKTKVVLMSGLKDDWCTSEAKRRGASDYVTKPFDPPRLAGAVARALHGQEQQRDEGH